MSEPKFLMCREDARTSPADVSTCKCCLGDENVALALDASDNSSMMDNKLNSDLEEFRKRWKQELENTAGKSPYPRPRLGGPVADRAEAEHDPESAAHNHVETSKEGGGVSRKRPWSDIEEARKTPNTLQSFLLAERLLEQSNNNSKPADPQATVSDVINAVTSNNHVGIKTKSKRGCVSSVRCGDDQHDSTKKTFLDLFLEDLEEINEIPFFDLELPRELALKMFQHLDVVDLCRCAQVSLAWRSLAEDEVLWCRLCHQLGFDKKIRTGDRQKWKEIVQEHITERQELQANWKSRTGLYSHLQYAKGGVLCAACSHNGAVIAGYTNGEVKFWDVRRPGEECVFQPSVKALELDPRDDGGTVANYITRVAMGDGHIVAGYNQGYVDVWLPDGSTSPTHTFRGPGAVNNLIITMETSLVAASFGSHVTVKEYSGESFTQTDSLDLPAVVDHMRLIPRFSDGHHGNVLVVLSAADSVKAHISGDEPQKMVDVHHTHGQFVTCMDTNLTQVAFGSRDYTSPFDTMFMLKLFSFESCREVAALHGHTAAPSCVALETSPEHLLASGCADKLVRVYDIRLPGGTAVMSLRGHHSRVEVIQMDPWKVISGGSDGRVCIWDQRMVAKLWELHNRHPVRYAKFSEDLLVTANIPLNQCPETDEFDRIPALRYRGSLHVYNFSNNQTTVGIPGICLSTYNEPEAYNYNVRLAMPYDTIH